MIGKVKSELDELQSQYPKDPSIAGYKSYISFTALALITYIVTFNQYSPELIGSVMYFIPIITGLTYYVFDDEGENIKQMIRYLLFILIITFVLYFAYLSAAQFTLAIKGFLAGGVLSVLNPVVSVVEVLIGVPVTAAFYHSIYVYYQILNEVGSDEETMEND